jgi:hypothetical protein
MNLEYIGSQMKSIIIPVVVLAFAGSIALAQQGNRGAHFIENWDQNEDGVVTLAEVTERRAYIFAAFDQEDDGFLSADDYVLFDEARANDQANNHGGGQGQGRKQGGRNSEGMTMEFNDSDGDGQVSLAEFMAGSADWFKLMDRNGDGAISTADFGPKP